MTFDPEHNRGVRVETPGKIHPTGRRGIIKAPVLSFDKKTTDPSSTIELLTISDVAGLMKISIMGVRRLKDAGHLAFHKVGGSIRFSKSDIVSYLEKSRVESVD